MFKYIIIFLLLVSCKKQKTQIKDYGTSKASDKSLAVPIIISDFNNYGELIDEIRQVTCNDSIVKIVLEQKDLVKNVYPIEYCEPIIFDPNEKHYVTFWNDGKPYEHLTLIEISADSLETKLIDDFSYYRTSSKTKEIENYLVIIESERTGKVVGIEEFLTNLTNAYDNLKTKSDLNVAFFEFSPPSIPIEEIE
ncbi:hypothetical protein [Flagellimonas oceanensis]|uniref:hypothetical protein n=1 Tax=Flagellimonas oceanensis TaxID=2499163 RepID=UPI000F8DAD7D|nr:hypothetical protein [Allomuricauda oceanensis]